MKSAASSEPGGVVQGSAYELMLAKLADDRRRLKQIQSIEKKIELKRQLLPDYADWIAGALAAGKGAQDDVLTTVLVWSIDACAYDNALAIAAYALQHKMTLPDQYERTLATMLLDDFSIAYLSGRMESAQVGVRIMEQVIALTADFDAPDQARAKAHKALAYALIGKVDRSDIDFDQIPQNTAAQAMPHLTRALALFDNVGVKKDIERLDRRLKKSASES